MEKGSQYTHQSKQGLVNFKMTQKYQQRYQKSLPYD